MGTTNKTKLKKGKYYRIKSGTYGITIIGSIIKMERYLTKRENDNHYYDGTHVRVELINCPTYESSVHIGNYFNIKEKDIQL